MFNTRTNKKRINQYFFLTSILFLLVSLSGCWSYSEKKERTVETATVTNMDEMSVGRISVIPQPASITKNEGEFVFSKNTKIVVTEAISLKMSNILNESLKTRYGIELEKTSETESENSISFSQIPDEIAEFKEGYNLIIEPNGIQLIGTERGLFYGLQSLNQILPLDFQSDVRLPAGDIVDFPRFQYRGMHLDVARHFMPVEFIKKYITVLARYKYNYFHWHLTDDQGWRIEIKNYPRLVSVGSKRSETVREKKYNPFVGDGIPVEGYYRREEIREIVEFAESKYITIIPEIDLPGHSSAALAAYPEFGCKTNYSYQVKKTWGGFPEVFCPTEETFEFINNVLDEVINLFPNSPYIHIGGDEVMTEHWKESKYVQALMRAKNLKTERDVQSWFISRVEKFVNSKGKQIIGWDEIFEEGIGRSATIMVWRDLKYGIQAARAGHKVIMTPSDFTYFDHPQAAPKTEPLSLGNEVSLENVYNFNPVSAKLSPEVAKNIIGGQGCVWTEFIKKPKNVEYMAFPRSLALAEVLWTKPKDKHFGDFLERLSYELPNLDKKDVSYRIPKPYGLENQTFYSNENTLVELSLPLQTGKVFYTLNGKEPTEESNIYESPIDIDFQTNKTVNLKVKVFTSNGRESSVYSANLRKLNKMRN